MPLSFNMPLLGLHQNKGKVMKESSNEAKEVLYSRLPDKDNRGLQDPQLTGHTQRLFVYQAEVRYF